MTVKEIRALTGLSQHKFAEKYEIPQRSIEHWESGTRKPPQYVVKMLERCVKMDLQK